MKYSPLIFIVLLLIGCSPNLNEQTENLVAGKNKWLKYAGNHDYSFIYKRTCNCTFTNSEILVHVMNNKVVSATLNNKKIETSTIQPMKQLFEYILEIMKKQEREGSHSIEVEYHQQYGYPTKVEFEKKNTMDSGVRIQITNVSLS